MSALFWVVESVFLLGMAFFLMMLRRNQWVYRKKNEMLRYCLDRPTEDWWDLGKPEPSWFYPEYEVMLNRFWVWDADKFLLRPKDLDERLAKIRSVECLEKTSEATH